MCDGRRDYLYDSGWHTFPGRMAVWCPHDPAHASYRISIDELPDDLPDATRWWVRGFLAGNVPEPPVELVDPAADKEKLARWFEVAKRFSEVGKWPSEDDLDAFLEGRAPLPAFMQPPT